MTVENQTRLSHVRYPRTAAKSLTVPQIVKAYHYPKYTGKGRTVGIIELGGGFRMSDMNIAASRFGVTLPSIVAVNVAGATNSPGGDADGEVLLDMQVVLGVAPGAAQRVYFAPNTDAGFLAAIKQAIVDRVDVISISWGGPETSWSPSLMVAFDKVFAQARAAGIVVTVASGDSGSSDGTSSPVVDFPASSPNVVACGGTKLTVTAAGERSTEVTWDDNDQTSATGGGTSKQFLGRNVPDVAGNASPSTGYQIVMNGSLEAIGGTSAVAPLYAGLVALLGEALGAPVGSKVDFMNTLLTNLGVCFDVTAGDNGAYRAGLGRDQVTGLGVVDGSKLLAVLADTTADPAPFPGQPTPTPTPVPVDPPVVVAPAPVLSVDDALANEMLVWLRTKKYL